MLTDEVKIKIHAGRGGDGAVAFDKVKMSLGPTGGRGGRGGSVYFEGVSDLAALNKYRSKLDYWAEDGERGKGDRSTGRDGKDLTLTVPIGSVLKNLQTKEEFDITEVGQKILAARGGSGGRGNFYFRSSTNTSPKQFEKGSAGESFEFFAELRLIAKVGLIGLPNAGKTSLLNELTKAGAKVGNYEFTTLEPNLGSLGGTIIADIPGLIEGASEGRGLGIKFLKHIRRTGMLLHCVSADSKDLIADYDTVRQELSKYDPSLAEKREFVLITKSDLLSPPELKGKISLFTGKKLQAMSVSIHDWESLERLKKLISDNS